jgi:uncharacterized membrane protein
MDIPEQGPCSLYSHDHPPIVDVGEKFEQSLSRGAQIADRVTDLVGSWPFIMVQSIGLFVWMSINVYLMLHPELLKAWDPYPFILLNLVLSFQAAYTGPFVLMSQSRQAAKDRLAAAKDFEINCKAEEEIKVIMDHLSYQDAMLAKISIQIEELSSRRA